MNPTGTQAPKRLRTNTAPRKGITRDRCTLCLDPLVSMKLSVEAHRRNIDRSDVVNQLLGDALRHIIISVREHSTGSVIPSGDVSQASVAVA